MRSTVDSRPQCCIPFPGREWTRGRVCKHRRQSSRSRNPRIIVCLDQVWGGEERGVEGRRGESRRKEERRKEERRGESR